MMPSHCTRSPSYGRGRMRISIHLARSSVATRMRPSQLNGRKVFADSVMSLRNCAPPMITCSQNRLLSSCNCAGVNSSSRTLPSLT